MYKQLTVPLMLCTQLYTAPSTCFSIMAPKCMKSTANVVSKKPHHGIDQEDKLKVIKDYKGRKSVMVTSLQSSTSHFTPVTI